MSSRRPRLFTKDDAIDLINANDSDVSDLDEGTDDEYQLSENESGDELSSSSEDDDVSDTVSATAASTSAAPESNRRLWKKGIFTAADAPFTGAAYQPPDNATEKSPLDYLLDFLKDDMIENACEQTNLYTTHKLGRTINLGAQEFLKAIGIFFQMGVVKMAGKRCYWETETRYSQVADVMPKNRFCQIVSSLHFTDNQANDNNMETDKCWKIRPWIERFRQECLKLVPEEKNSVDEMMIPFKGKFSGIRQYIRGKPNPWGLKVWARCGLSGIIYDFDIYQGKSTNPERNSLGVGASVVLKLIEALPANQNYHIFADNFFTTVQLLAALKDKGFKYTGTVRSNRIKEAKLQTEKELKKKPRGSSDFSIETTKNITAVRWHDTKCVTLLSTHEAIEPVSKCRRFDKRAGAYVEINMPHAVKEYNAGMGGVDLLDSLISKSKFNMKSRRWYLYIFWHSLQLMVTNAWLVYHRDCDILGIPKKERLILRKFQTRIGLALCYSKTTPRRGRPSLDNDANGQPPVRVRRITQGPVVDVQKDRFDHWPLKGPKRLRCKVCKTVKTDTMCEKCKVNLCFTEARNCFRTYHV